MKYVRHAEQHETVDIKLVDGVFVKATTFPAAGMVVPQHAHEYDHLSYIASGAARVEAGGTVLGEFRAPASLVIRSHLPHLFTTLEPGTTVLCIHNADRAEAGEVAVHAEHHLEFEGE